MGRALETAVPRQLPLVYAHKGPELGNTARTGWLDSALVCGGVLRNSGRCVRDGSQRAPKTAVPRRTMVAPSAMAHAMSRLMPIDNSNDGAPAPIRAAASSRMERRRA